MEVSSNRCWALLQDIFRPLEESVKQGTFSKPGGYYLFVQETQRLKEKYQGQPKKGLQVPKMFIGMLETIASKPLCPNIQKMSLRHEIDGNL